MGQPAGEAHVLAFLLAVLVVVADRQVGALGDEVHVARAVGVAAAVVQQEDVAIGAELLGQGLGEGVRAAAGTAELVGDHAGGGLAVEGHAVLDAFQLGA
ncbi:hypothetical protein FQZ97_962220 [compost metagenome]